jgi:hypothetical protein
MFCDQISCIINNTSSKLYPFTIFVTAIDKLQKTKEERQTKKTKWQRLDEVFNGGRGFSIHYFLPTDIPLQLLVESEFE